MDGGRFDCLIRSLGPTSGRRAVVGFLSGLALRAAGLPLAHPVIAGKRRCKPCQRKKRGKCRRKRPDGTLCGADTQGGILRCCNGGCPQPTCLAVGTSCGALSQEECLTACCSGALECQARGGCACVVRPIESGVPPSPCASDGDCRNPSGAAQCVCGRCCVPAGSPKPAALPCGACCSGACAGTGDTCA
jgi:hypothetical protein